MSPLDWINDKLAQFLGLPAKWDAWYEEARQIFEAEARYRFSRGIPVQGARELAAIETLVQLDQMRREWAGVYGKLVIDERAALGQLPVQLIVVAVRLVAVTIIVLAITGLFKKSSAMESIVADLRSMGATPDQVLKAMQVSRDEKSALESVATGAVSLLKWIVLGGIAMAVVPRLLDQRK